MYIYVGKDKPYRCNLPCFRSYCRPSRQGSQWAIGWGHPDHQHGLGWYCYHCLFSLSMGDGPDLDLQSFVVPKSFPRLLLQVVLLSVCTQSLRLLVRLISFVTNKPFLAHLMFFFFGLGKEFKKTSDFPTSIVGVTWWTCYQNTLILRYAFLKIDFDLNFTSS